jgi:hypothetical protein
VEGSGGAWYTKSEKTGKSGQGQKLDDVIVKEPTEEVYL